ncbi:amino acid ABC transporter permease [Fodinicola feengrottensis]|uniref:Amino acid ABC transporter permease n=1 Tax=Fodinicola feengrottensis TaxID=435914 RepID=A0ABN2ITS9_9ACTN
MSTASVLFDAPGPKAQARYLTGGIVGSVVLVAVFAFVVYRFWVTGQFDGQKWSIFEYQQVQLTILSGYLNTLAAAAMAAVLAVTLGALLAAARLSDHRWLRGPAFAVVELFRAIPLLLLMFLAYYAAPGIGLTFSPFWSVVLGLTLYNGSVLAEIFRAGVEAVPKGQAEAAYAIGMRKTQVMTTVLLPQAVRTMLPTIISQLVVLLKDTALGFLVTYDELLKQLKQLATAPDFAFPLIPLTLVGGSIYIATCLLLAFLANRLEARTRRSVKVAPGAVDAADAAGAAAQGGGAMGGGAPPIGGL